MNSTLYHSQLKDLQLKTFFSTSLQIKKKHLTRFIIFIIWHRNFAFFSVSAAEMYVLKFKLGSPLRTSQEPFVKKGDDCWLVRHSSWVAKNDPGSPVGPVVLGCPFGLGGPVGPGGPSGLGDPGWSGWFAWSSWLGGSWWSGRSSTVEYLCYSIENKVF